jgi:hypothetical protein
VPSGASKTLLWFSGDLGEEMAVMVAGDAASLGIARIMICRLAKWARTIRSNSAPSRSGRFGSRSISSKLSSKSFSQAAAPLRASTTVQCFEESFSFHS